MYIPTNSFLPILRYQSNHMTVPYFTIGYHGIKDVSYHHIVLLLFVCLWRAKLREIICAI